MTAQHIHTQEQQYKQFATTIQQRVLRAASIIFSSGVFVFLL